MVESRNPNSLQIKVTALTKGGLNEFIQSTILKKQELKEPFYVLNLSVVKSLYDKWIHNLPMIHPFYAVKCNPNTSLLGALAALGSNFDCASQAEIETVLSLGVSPDRIIYANPCKADSHIKYAASVGVNLTTFDSCFELEKIKKLHPNCDLLLRIKSPEDSGARCQLGPKYGALPEEVEPLLLAAQTAQLNVIGVSFHIGSGAANPTAYRAAIEAARAVFDTASKLGLPEMYVLDIGGGFTSANPEFEEAALVLKAALQTYFPSNSGLKMISEPGRFLAESAFTLATNIIGKRTRGELREYWINDGIYGSMNCILYDNATVTCVPLVCTCEEEEEGSKKKTTYRSTVFGPTCDALDTVLTDYELPELEVSEDWLVFSNMGAYTAAAGSGFNGFNTAAIFTYLVY